MSATCLHSRHINLDAKMTEFSGWNMPLRYQSQIQEHQAVRTQCGIFDVSHMMTIDITGEDARTLLRKVHCNDVANSINSGSGLYGCMLNDKAGVIDDLICYIIHEKHYRIVVNAGRREVDLCWIQKQAIDMNVNIQPQTEYGILALQGPSALPLLAQTNKEYTQVSTLSNMQGTFITDELFIARSGYTGEDGVEIIAPEKIIVQFWDTLTAAGAQPCGLGARDSLRLEAGMCLYGHELSESISPLEAGIGWCVDWSDPHRDFIGKSALESQKNTGRPRRLVGLVLNDKGVMRTDQEVTDEHNATIGIITSGGFSPTLNKSIALALIDASWRGEHCFIESRNKLQSATVTKTSFVRKGQLLINL